ncbi:hypothetical protein SAMN05421879_107188 [Ornithinimicrobium cerasi]|uniref:Uncharacterized protein n=1 Tax=Ornithinimicrobium cerasi TaxID=2248773 RepID=A0A285VT86_9MICO|nr:hypothetical protein SAMN05421879_107188 [Ornithinimicrobium cerasi]
MTLIWATRGRNWGFRFLRDGGLADPLPTYDGAFAGIGTGTSAYKRVGTTVAVRFPDPAGRKDSAGRVIPHDLVVLPPLSSDVHSVEDALQRVWPLLAEEFERTWDSDPDWKVPSARQ